MARQKYYKQHHIQSGGPINHGNNPSHSNNNNRGYQPQRRKGKWSQQNHTGNFMGHNYPVGFHGPPGHNPNYKGRNFSPNHQSNRRRLQGEWGLNNGNNFFTDPEIFEDYQQYAIYPSNASPHLQKTQAIKGKLVQAKVPREATWGQGVAISTDDDLSYLLNINNQKMEIEEPPYEFEDDRPSGTFDPILNCYAHARRGGLQPQLLEQLSDSELSTMLGGIFGGAGLTHPPIHPISDDTFRNVAAARSEAWMRNLSARVVDRVTEVFYGTNIFYFEDRDELVQFMNTVPTQSKRLIRGLSLGSKVFKRDDLPPPFTQFEETIPDTQLVGTLLELCGLVHLEYAITWAFDENMFSWLYLIAAEFQRLERLRFYSPSEPPVVGSHAQEVQAGVEHMVGLVLAKLQVVMRQRRELETTVRNAMEVAR